jgi:hypothetical protein
MNEVFVHADSARLGYCKSLLEDAGIACYIRNEHTNFVFTTSSLTSFSPALCVSNEADLPAALALIEESQRPDEPVGKEWQCPACGEKVPPGFDLCWNCETGRPAGQSPPADG